MAANQVVGRISGLVTFTDGTTGAFGASLDINGIVADTIADGNDFKQIYQDQQALLDSVFLTTLGVGAFSAAAPTNSKTVSDFVIEVSGRASYDDNTTKDFGVQYTVKGGVVELVTGSSTTINEIGAVAALNTKLDALLETVVGSGRITLP